MLLILTALLFHVWSCHSSVSFFSGICRFESFLGIMYRLLFSFQFLVVLLKLDSDPVDMEDDDGIVNLNQFIYFCISKS